MYNDLASAAFYYPAIDNHAHPLLNEKHRAAMDFKGLVSEAAPGEALDDSVHTLASMRTVSQLSKILKCPPTWNAVCAAREQLDYTELCEMFMRPTGIQCILIDDGLGGVQDYAEKVSWHDKFTKSPTKRIVRLEVVAEELFLHALKDLKANQQDVHIAWIRNFLALFNEEIAALAQDAAGFKSVACYRTGLDIFTSCTDEELMQSVLDAIKTFGKDNKLRLASKHLNDYLVRSTLEIAGKFNKPVQFHTGLGDNDIRLARSSPAHMQPIIEAYPNTKFVLLHSSYPFTQEAGYLTSVYANVYLDFGEIFPFVSADGQRTVVRQMLELCPTNKIMWSTDGHWWPESYYLGTIQARQALYEVLSDYISRDEITEEQAVSIVRRALFENANVVYNLGLELDIISLTTSTYKASPLSHSVQIDVLTEFADSGVRYIRVHWLDPTNFVQYRVIPIKKFRKMLSLPRPGITLTKAPLGVVFEQFSPGFTSTGEYLYVPDLSSLRRCGYVEGHASVMGYFEEKEPVKRNDGKATVESNLCPRSLLRQTIKLAHEIGIEFLVGFNTGFILLKSTSPIEPASGYGWRTSTIPTDSNVAKVMEEIAEALVVAGVDLEHYHSEFPAGQHEVVIGPTAPIEAADALIATRETIFHIADKYRMRATLAPRVFPDQCGSATQVHISMRSTSGKMSTETELSAVPSMTTMEGAFLQSLLDHLPSVCAFSLPIPASYDRGDDDAHAGSTYVCWGRDNRETPVRLRGFPGQWNFEIKSLDGTANPYLALNAILNAGMLGVRKGLTLTARDCQGVAAELDETRRQELGITTRLPQSLEEARKSLMEDKELVDVLGDEFVEKYLLVNQTVADALEKSDPESNRRLLVNTY